MPINYANYPPNWKQISNYIRFVRAEGKCEECGVKHRAWVLRDGDKVTTWNDGEVSKRDNCVYVVNIDAEGNYISELETYPLDAQPRPVEIILTVAHLDHDTTNNDESNLKALCQRCHLRYDAQLHGKNAKATRARKKAAAVVSSGQQALEI